MNISFLCTKSSNAYSLSIELNIFNLLQLTSKGSWQYRSITMVDVLGAFLCSSHMKYFMYIISFDLHNHSR